MSFIIKMYTKTMSSASGVQTGAQQAPSCWLLWSVEDWSDQSSPLPYHKMKSHVVRSSLVNNLNVHLKELHGSNVSRSSLLTSACWGTAQCVVLLRMHRVHEQKALGLSDVHTQNQTIQSESKHTLSVTNLESKSWIKAFVLVIVLGARSAVHRLMRCAAHCTQTNT